MPIEVKDCVRSVAHLHRVPAETGEITSGDLMVGQFAILTGGNGRSYETAVPGHEGHIVYKMSAAIVCLEDGDYWCSAGVKVRLLTTSDAITFVMK